MATNAKTPRLLRHLIGKKFTVCCTNETNHIESETEITAVRSCCGVACISSRGMMPHENYISADTLGTLLLRGAVRVGNWEYKIEEW